jgi:hypothetical protein
MSRVQLPDGVPPDNRARGFAAPSGFAAPDTATPAFDKSREGLRDHDRVGLSRVVIEVDDEDDDEMENENEDDKLIHGPHHQAQTLILIAIGLVLAALAAYVVSQNQNPAPLCANQPEWNQYNCRAG